MGRTNGKLKTFLIDGLQKNSFCNLKWEDPDSCIFSLKLPRYEKRKDLKDYEKILIEWYIINHRKYPGYSGAKAVLQAALKKSVYLVYLNNESSDLRIRFATKAEEQEKRRKQKLDSNLILLDPLQEASHQNLVSVIKSEMPLLCELEYSFQSLPSPKPPLPSFSPPLSLPSLSPSPSTSSGYQSGSEDLDENISVSEEINHTENCDFLDTLVDDFLQNPDNYINALQDKDIEMDIPSDIIDESFIIPSDIIEDNIVIPTEENVASIPQVDVKINGAEFMQPSVQLKPVLELTATEVDSSKKLNTYWLCTKKLYIDPTLLLICDKQVIKDENQGMTPGQIDFNNVLEPGEFYNLREMCEIDGKCFLFLSRNR